MLIAVLLLKSSKCWNFNLLHVFDHFDNSKCTDTYETPRFINVYLCTGFILFSLNKPINIVFTLSNWFHEPSRVYPIRKTRSTGFECSARNERTRSNRCDNPPEVWKKLNLINTFFLFFYKSEIHENNHGCIKTGEMQTERLQNCRTSSLHWNITHVHHHKPLHNFIFHEYFPSTTSRCRF